MSKASKVIKIVSPLLVAIASLVMVILAIVNLANGGKSAQDITIAFRIIISAMLILGALASTYVVVSKDPKHFDVRLVVYNGLLLGLGIFVVLGFIQISQLNSSLSHFFVPSAEIIGLFEPSSAQILEPLNV